MKRRYTKVLGAIESLENALSDFEVPEIETLSCPSSNKWNRRSDYLMESSAHHFHITRRVVGSANDVSRWSLS